jgi:hypothetical protein
MKIEFDIFNTEFFRTLTFSLTFQKKAQVSIIYMKTIVFLLPSCTTGTRSVNNEIMYVLITRIQFNISFYCDGFSVGVI